MMSSAKPSDRKFVEESAIAFVKGSTATVFWPMGPPPPRKKKYDPTNLFRMNQNVKPA